MSEKFDEVESIELWGERFKRAQFGLDEEQVKSFVNCLLQERDMLLDREKCIGDLIAMAEKTLKESQDLALIIRREAEEQASKLIEHQRIEAREIALKEAEDIKVKAFIAAQNDLKMAEDKARVIVTQALLKSFDKIEKRQLEDEETVKRRIETEIASILADTKKLLKEDEQVARSQARAQAQTILSSFRQ